MSNIHVLKVKVRDTENVLFEGEVDRIASFNEIGPFDVYPMHANFISIIRKELALYQHHKKVKELKLKQAIMKVKKDVVHIYLGIESLFFQDDAVMNEIEKPQKSDKNHKKGPKLTFEVASTSKPNTPK